MAIGKKLRVFPLEGSMPQMIELTDLPGDSIEQICAFNSKLYAVLSNLNRIAWFIEIDVETKTNKILSSTSAREGKTPFVNVSPAPRFSCLLADEERKRLLFFLHDKRPEWGGIWSMDGNTGAFTQHLYCPPMNQNNMQIHDESGRISIFGAGYTEVFDLNIKDEDGTPKPPLKEKHVLSGAVLFRNALWGVKQSGNQIVGFQTVGARITLEENTQPEHLPMLEVTKNHKHFGQIIPLPNDKGLVVVGNDSIILLRFEQP
jgi:hypothetical protein